MLTAEQQERERIKAVIERKFNATIEFREENIRDRKRRIISVFERLKGKILFSIDNPDYVRTTKDKDEDTEQEDINIDFKPR